MFSECMYILRVDKTYTDSVMVTLLRPVCTVWFPSMSFLLIQGHVYHVIHTQITTISENGVYLSKYVSARLHAAHQ